MSAAVDRLKKWWRKRLRIMYQTDATWEDLRDAMVMALEEALGEICRNKSCPHTECTASGVRSLIAELRGER